MVADTHIYHVPALLKEVLAFFEPLEGHNYIDCTLGEGGVTQAIVNAGGRVLGLEADPEMLPVAARRLETAEGNYTLAQANFASLKEVADNLDFRPVHGIIIDLGLSSRQLQAEQRGFTFQQEQPLDMRYDPTRQEVSAADMVNDLPEEELIDLFMTFAEEDRWSARTIARTIISRRPIYTTRELVESVELAVGRRSAARIHPATKVFMGLRIAVNADLQALESALPQALELLEPSGRLLVIGYQSLEDRIVKRFLQHEAKDCICPPVQPVCTCGHMASIRLLRRGVITASVDEISRNPASRSARLRVAERLPTAAA